MREKWLRVRNDNRFRQVVSTDAGYHARLQPLTSIGGVLIHGLWR